MRLPLKKALVGAGISLFPESRAMIGVFPFLVNKHQQNTRRRLDSNQRPPGYEPGELPDCSTPPQWIRYSASHNESGAFLVRLGTYRVSDFFRCSNAHTFCMPSFIGSQTQFLPPPKGLEMAKTNGTSKRPCAVEKKTPIFTFAFTNSYLQIVNPMLLKCILILLL